MNGSNVRLILAREIRDQVRDRRTLFMIFVLPILLYPLLGMSFFQVAQFLEEKPSRVLMVGAKGVSDAADLPSLVDPQRMNRFDVRLFSDPVQVGLLELSFAPEEPRDGPEEREEPWRAARRAVQAGEYDAAVFFPPDFVERMQRFQRANRSRLEEKTSPAEATEPEDPLPLAVPEPKIIFSTANEKSQIAFARLFDVLQNWRQEIVKDQLVAAGLPTAAARPFNVATSDVAEETGHRGAAVWSKVLPILLLVWAMTGAFYPAVDLCAGEKERGTLETLLCSPAERSEIVLGKLVTIMLFSMATAALNIVSMGMTGWLVLAQLPQFGPPPAMAVVWLSLALVPVSALFSALCLALAAFAKSTKEGQYYLMPLLLVTMPLVVLPMAPGVELNLGNSLIPVTGVVLLLRSMIEGNVVQALPFAAPVSAVTLGCCLLAIRWAVEQFNSESVLFRESERLDPTLWVRHLLEDRRPTPSASAAVFCGLLILLVNFFLNTSLARWGRVESITGLVLLTQLAVIAAPALVLTLLLTTSPRRTLLLRRPRWLTLPAAATLAIVLYPTVVGLAATVHRLYPVSDVVKKQVEGVFQDANIWHLFVLIAVVPAICEELAFRGFILSGFRHLGHKWRAIVYSALFFGLTHSILQQQLIASLVGVVIGFVAVQTGSLLPAIVFHLIHNGLQLLMAHWSRGISPAVLDRWPGAHFLMFVEDGSLVFRWPVIAASAVAAFVLLRWFHALPYEKSTEEERYAAQLRAQRRDD